MPPDDSYLRHQRQRWTRHDAHLWVRPDAARFLPPGMDPADLYPTLKRKPGAAKEAAFEAELAAEVAKGYQLVAVLREELASLRDDMKRRRELEAKYSPTQPRVARGNPDGGQWRNRNEGGAGVGNFGSADGEARAEDAGSSGGSQDAANSEAESPERLEADGARGYDDRLAGSDNPSPGRAAMLGIMARAAARVMEAYRSEKGLFDLFGNRDGTVAYTTIDDKDIFGANSNSPTYTATDRLEAEQMRIH
jgi:hypothetical protein